MIEDILFFIIGIQKMFSKPVCSSWICFRVNMICLNFRNSVLGTVVHNYVEKWNNCSNISITFI